MFGRNLNEEEIKKFLEQYDLREGLDWKFVKEGLHTDVLLSTNAITVLSEAIDTARNS